MKKLNGLMAAAWSGLVAFSVLPAGTAHAFAFSIFGYECPSVRCVDLAAGGYDVSGGGLVSPAKDKRNTYLTPGTENTKPVDLVDDSAKVGSFNVTSLIDDPTGAASPVVVTQLPGLFTFFWGSVETHNLVEFFDKDGSLVGSVRGGDIAALAGVSNQDSAGRFNFDVYVGFEGRFDKAKLSIIPGVGTGIAFEVATPVPEPATYALIGAAGLAMLGVAARRRRAV